MWPGSGSVKAMTGSQAKKLLMCLSLPISILFACLLLEVKYTMHRSYGMYFALIL